MGYTLGISAFYHDSAAVLTLDGTILAAAQEERFSRKKGDEGFPSLAVKWCLEKEGLEPKDLDAVVFYDKPIIKFDRLLASYLHRAPLGLRSFLMAIPLWLKSKLWTEDRILKELKGYKGEVFFTDHHQSHGASAFFPSPFESACVLTVDGAGEWTTATIGVGESNTLKTLKKMRFPHSLGLLYSAFTQYCGFRVNSGEYKLMGLAPYRKPVYEDLIFSKIVTLHEDGSFVLNQKYFNYISGLSMLGSRFAKLFGRPALGSDHAPDQFYMDVAASIQRVTEVILVRMATYAQKLTGLKNLVMAGGVALNCVANEKILKESGFEHLWVQPAAGDAGGALGAALYHDFAYKNTPRTAAGGKQDTMNGALLGPSFTSDEVEKTLNKRGAVYQRISTALDGSNPELDQIVAQYLEAGKVVGWVQGPMEFGPRALGSRSILGDPRSQAMQSVMNLKIKFRESFRPFAPAVLEEAASAIFNHTAPSPYMLMVAGVKPEHHLPLQNPNARGMELLNQPRSPWPAITHVDYSARLQTVSDLQHPRFAQLIRAFEHRTGCPMVINTSFNVRGEPIVCTPDDAFRCFLGTEMDVLVIGDCLMLKNEQTVEVDWKNWRKTWIKD